MFADAALAARIDRAEARLCAEIANFVGARRPHTGSTVIPISGGLAVYVSPSSPVNKVIGLALDPAMDMEALERIETEWRRKGEPVRVELSVLADPSIGGVLTDRLYRLHGFENVLGLALDGTRVEPATTNVSVEVVQQEQLQQWIEIAVDAFMNLDGTGSVPDDALPREQLAKVLEEVMGAPGFIHYLARVDGEAVGEAAMRIDGPGHAVTGQRDAPRLRAPLCARDSRPPLNAVHCPTRPLTRFCPCSRIPRAEQRACAAREAECR